VIAAFERVMGFLAQHGRAPSEATPPAGRY
jgi:hypothetical protein